MVTDAAIQHMLEQELYTYVAFPGVGPNTLLFVYL
ncbi:MAG: hypothetical protein QOE94_1532, partial [Mycobacterium sp.]|nr:hypothetical protein [Mycobacterium sp.]